jgi:hypothetical protein
MHSLVKVSQKALYWHLIHVFCPKLSGQSYITCYIYEGLEGRAVGGLQSNTGQGA